MNTQKFKWISTVMLAGFVGLLGSSCGGGDKQDDSALLLSALASRPSTPAPNITCGTSPTVINVGTSGTPRVTGASVASGAHKWYIISSAAAVTVKVVSTTGDADLYVGLAGTDYTTRPADYVSNTTGIDTVTTQSGTGTQRCLAIAGWTAATYDLYVY